MFNRPTTIPSSSVLALMLALGGAATAADLHVPGAFPSIQSAVDQAKPGDRVIVAPGTYLETIDLGQRAITLMSSHGAEYTTIDGGTQNTVLRNPGNGTVITGFRMTRGFAALGGGMHIDAASPMILSCIFDSNQATFGGGIYVRNGAAPIFFNCIVINNSASFGGGIYCRDAAAPIFIDGVISNNAANSGGGGGVHSLNASPVLHRCLIELNQSTLKSGGGIFASGGAIAVRESMIDLNSAFEHGAGVYLSGGQPIFDAVHFRHNFAMLNGGGIYSMNSPVRVVNSLLHDNSAQWGGGAFAVGGMPHFINVTMSRNFASAGGGALRAVSSGPVIRNSIIWENLPDEVSRAQDATNVMHSCIRGGWSGAGGENITADPLFMNAALNDFRLQTASPACNAGDQSHLPEEGGPQIPGEPTTGPPFLRDLDGMPRVVAGVIDMGAFEVQPPPCTGDINGDGRVDMSDLLAVLRMWGQTCEDCPEDTNGDGHVSVADLIIVLSQWGNCPQ